VPSILLQPLIENSIKHGLEPRINGGTVTLAAAWRATGADRVPTRLSGHGQKPARLGHEPRRRRIGMKNVRERLEAFTATRRAFTRVVANPRPAHPVSDRIPAESAGAGITSLSNPSQEILARTDGRARTSACHGRAPAIHSQSLYPANIVRSRLASGSEWSTSTGFSAATADSGRLRAELPGKLFARYELVAQEPETLDAVIVTHEHSTTSTAGCHRPQLGIPVYSTKARTGLERWLTPRGGR